MTRILIIGAGITGTVTASLIRSRLLQSCYIEIWEKSGRAGGRMNTCHHNQEPWCSVDLGAQYISPTPQEYQEHIQFYNELEGSSLLKPMVCNVEGDRDRPAGTRHYVAPLGMSSVVKHFLTSSGANVYYGRPVRSLLMTDGGIKVASNDTVHKEFDCVVLTTPVPDIFRIGGDLQGLIDSNCDVKKRLEEVEYSSRFAVGLFFEAGKSLSLGWTMKYFDDPVVRYVSVDAERRSVAHCTRPSLVVHTTVQLGLDAAEKDVDGVCYDVILPRLHSLLPQLPKALFVTPRRWRYSQVYKGYAGSPGVLTLSNSPLLVIGGDAFTYSKFDGCISSANHIAETVVDFVQKRFH